MQLFLIFSITMNTLHIDRFGFSLFLVVLFTGSCDIMYPGYVDTRECKVIELPEGIVELSANRFGKTNITIKLNGTYDVYPENFIVTRSYPDGYYYEQFVFYRPDLSPEPGPSETMKMSRPFKAENGAIFVSVYSSPPNRLKKESAILQLDLFTFLLNEGKPVFTEPIVIEFK